MYCCYVRTSGAATLGEKSVRSGHSVLYATSAPAATQRAGGLCSADSVRRYCRRRARAELSSPHSGRGYGGIRRSGGRRYRNPTADHTSDPGYREVRRGPTAGGGPTSDIASSRSINPRRPGASFPSRRDHGRHLRASPEVRRTSPLTGTPPAVLTRGQTRSRSLRSRHTGGATGGGIRPPFVSGRPSGNFTPCRKLLALDRRMVRRGLAGRARQTRAAWKPGDSNRGFPAAGRAGQTAKPGSRARQTARGIFRVGRLHGRRPADTLGVALLASHSRFA